MSKSSKDELVKRTHPRYLQAGRAEKTRILDEFVAATGYHRKHAIWKLRKGIPECRRERRGRKRTYTGDAIGVLAKIWRFCSLWLGRRTRRYLCGLCEKCKRETAALGLLRANIGAFRNIQPDFP